MHFVRNTKLTSKLSSSMSLRSSDPARYFSKSPSTAAGKPYGRGTVGWYETCANINITFNAVMTSGKSHCDRGSIVGGTDRSASQPARSAISASSLARVKYSMATFGRISCSCSFTRIPCLGARRCQLCVFQ